MILAVSILAISLSLLLYHHPPSTWASLYAPTSDGAASPRLDKSQSGDTEHSAPDEQRHMELQEQTSRNTPGNAPSEASPPATPRAAPQEQPDAPAVPTFCLESHGHGSLGEEEDDDDDDDDDDNMPPPSFPALNSAQRASGPGPSPTRAPSAKPTTPMAPPMKPAASSLMPPPRVAPSSLRALPTSSQSMRVPTTRPLPNRGPLPNRAPRSSSGGLGIPSSGRPVANTPNTRGKVLLSVGHSPLDWAHLLKSGKNLSGVDTMMRVTPAMLKEKNGRKGRPAWSAYQGKVYNISPYLPFHPGGEGELRRASGKDGTRLFMEVHPWVNWENMLGECMVGIMVSEDAAHTVTGASLEDMD